MKKLQSSLKQKKKNPIDLIQQAKRRFKYKPKNQSKFFTNNSTQNKKNYKNSQYSTIKQNHQKNSLLYNDSAWFDKFLSAVQIHQNKSNLFQQKKKSMNIHKQSNQSIQPSIFLNKTTNTSKNKFQNLKKVKSSSFQKIKQRQKAKKQVQEIISDEKDYSYYDQQSVQYPKLFETMKKKNTIINKINNQYQQKNYPIQFQVTVLKVEEPEDEFNSYVFQSNKQKTKPRNMSNSIKKVKFQDEFHQNKKNQNQNKYVPYFRQQNILYKKDIQRNKLQGKIGKIKKNNSIINQKSINYSQSNINSNFLSQTSPIKKKKTNDSYIQNSSPIHQTHKIDQSVSSEISKKGSPLKNSQLNSSMLSSPLKKSCLKQKSITKYHPQIIHQVEQQQNADKNIILQQKLIQIFKQLDQKKLGYVDKSNCNTQILNDQVRYLIGSILSKIKYQEKKYNQRQFIQSSKGIISSLQNHEINKFLKDASFKRIFDLQTKRSNNLIGKPNYVINQNNHQKKNMNTNNSLQISPTKKNVLYQNQKRKETNYDRINLKQSIIQRLSGRKQYSKQKMFYSNQIPVKGPYLDSTYLNQTIKQNDQSIYYLEKEQFNKINKLNERLQRYIDQNKLKNNVMESGYDNIRLQFAELRKHLRQ